MTAPAITDDDTLTIAEHHGPTWQGEGPSLGTPAAVVRFPNGQEPPRRAAVADIVTAVDGYHTPLAVITGGEPLHYQSEPGWNALLDALARAGKRIEVETTGAVAPSSFTAAVVHGFNVTTPHGRPVRPDVLRDLAATGKAAFKFPCRIPDDVDAAAMLTADLGIPPHHVWILPDGRTPDVVREVAPRIAPRARFYRFAFSPRLHIELCDIARPSGQVG